ncbi:MAG: protein-methionine-sulfoxide reductase catalytic subunit MsrP [Gammaproteobacteria bacterium]|nr:protein-methionine-sulfoxide reductase catalytic subunit MsrP [Gammaproteobacteria bacterium]MDH4315256.1 protein-methionine-sulfoxide reductase catalytic subunit MsrP [Gammaproteobacteria bacterium]MDH5215529.1 protein-methionine-sulfoxide reductase catalytic subunit MsrP [Gammaproteobacteria bacterium]
MLIRKPAVIRPSAITPRETYFNRRELLRAAMLAGGAAFGGPALSAALPDGKRARLDDIKSSRFSTDEELNSYTDVTTYNNYYEFGTSKSDPFRNAQDFEARPWTIRVSGHAEKTGVFDLEDFIRPYDLEERIYRLRCVERWSMVIPWVGVSLAEIVKRHQPLSNAKYVRFETLLDPKQMPGQRYRTLDWPYVEGLTIAEATHPLAILAVGVYGEVLPNQNGAPIRLVVPWKYGFKGIKGIVSMEFTEKRPIGSWERAAPNEYGFYANVNPNVDHPRWSQARERRIGASGGTGFQSLLGASMQDTLMFNGYGEQVAHLYDGLDLRRNF